MRLMRHHIFMQKKNHHFTLTNSYSYSYKQSTMSLMSGTRMRSSSDVPPCFILTSSSGLSGDHHSRYKHPCPSTVTCPQPLYPTGHLKIPPTLPPTKVVPGRHHRSPLKLRRLTLSISPCMCFIVFVHKHQYLPCELCVKHIILSLRRLHV